ncbi:hypothetical protein C1646_667886 [Rhizophagus diaphanus]|nr:hypothetical protein C1646_667886 [Rhizophagus diaphanus] [Rhizophagus sp. MUCL 43196]
MDVPRELFGHERNFKNFVQHIPNTVQCSREREQRVLRNQDEKQEYLKIIIDGATIPVSTIWDALALFYTNNIGKPPESLTSLDQQTRWVIQHLNQLARWISIFEPEVVETIRNRHLVQPNTTAVAWKLEGHRIMKISFGTSLIGEHSVRERLIKFRQKVDSEIHRLFPQDANGRLLKSLTFWPFESCAETTTLFHLVSWRRGLPIRTYAIQTASQEMMSPCANCQLIIP